MKNSKKFFQVINTLFLLVYHKSIKAFSLMAYQLVLQKTTIQKTSSSVTKNISWIISILILTTMFFSSCGSSRKSQSIKTNLSGTDYISKYKELAIKEMDRSGIPASITLAQGMLESGYGNSTLARKSNNHFGIKCHGWKGAKVYHDDDKRNECFRKYKDVYQSFKDHSDFISVAPRYRFLFNYQKTDYKSWAKGLKKAGYATDPKYAYRLIDLIETYKLHKFDKGKIPSNINIEDKEKKQQQVHVPGDNWEFGIEREVYKNNGVRYIIASEDDTYKKIAKEMEMMPWEVYKYNDLPRDASITKGQKIYIQPKKRRAEKGQEYHKVKQGETMYTIAQKYGIKLKHLYRMNRIEEGTSIKPGIRIWLRKKRDQPLDKDDKELQSNYEFTP